MARGNDHHPATIAMLGAWLATLAEAMKRIEYRGLDLAHLRVSDSDGTD